MFNSSFFFVFVFFFWGGGGGGGGGVNSRIKKNSKIQKSNCCISLPVYFHVLLSFFCLFRVSYE